MLNIKEEEDNVIDLSGIKGLSKAALLKSDTNFITVEFGYDLQVVLPYKDATQLVALMENAEIIDNSDYSNPKITSFLRRDKFKIQILSQPDYLRYKLANLLGVPSGDIDETNLIGLRK